MFYTGRNALGSISLQFILCLSRILLRRCVNGGSLSVDQATLVGSVTVGPMAHVAEVSSHDRSGSIAVS